MISSAPFMSHQPVIDGFEFASAGATQEGLLPLSGFPRLQDVLVSHAGEVAYSVHGVRDERGRLGLELTVEGTLQLRCQRCLGHLAYEVRSHETLLLAASQAQIDAEPVDVDAPDWVLGGKEMALAELVEDELILALPYAPHHESCTAPESTDPATSSPFAALRGLMQRKH